MKKNLKRFSDEIYIFLALLVTCASFHHPVEYDNTLSRFFLVHSVVVRGVLNIDDNQDITIDDSFANGHYYSNKAIGAPLLGIPFYWIVNKVPLRKTPYADLNINIEDMYFVRVLSTTIPFAVLGAVLFNFSLSLGRGRRESLWMVLCYSFGTIALLHAMLFSGHQIAASLSFFSFVILYRLSNKRGLSVNFFSAFFAGLLAGLAALSDYTAMFTALCITVYMFSLKLSLRDRTLFLSGGLICIFILAGYNYFCFGNPLSLSYGNLVEQDFREGAESGFMGVSFPDFGVLLLLLLSPSRGLFFISPVLLYSLSGLYEMRKEYPREMLLILTLFSGYLVINAGFYGWHGGWSYGPRYLVPVLPFLALPAVFAVAKSNKLFFVLLCVSLFQVGLAAFGAPHTPDLFKNPVVDFMFPLIGYGYVAKSAGNLMGLGWIYGAIPVFLVASGLIFYLFSQMPSENRPVKSHGKWFISFSVLVIIYIISMLLFPASGNAPAQSHVYKSNMLYMYSKVTNSEEVYMGGLQEELMATEKMGGQGK